MLHAFLPFIVVRPITSWTTCPGSPWRSVARRARRARSCWSTTPPGDGTPDWVKAHPKLRPQSFSAGTRGQARARLGLSRRVCLGDPASRHRAVRRGGPDGCRSCPMTRTRCPICCRRWRPGADLVLATRYREGVRVTNWPLHRLMLSLGAAQVCEVDHRHAVQRSDRRLQGVPARTNWPTLDLSQIHSDGYAFQIEVTYMAWRLGWKIERSPHRV